MHAAFDFGCGSGSSSIALAMLFPQITCHGGDISEREVSLARERARLYGVAERCKFGVIDEGAALPVADNAYDLCMCCSVLEYITEPAIRKFYVQEMARIITPGGFLLISVPNRPYPFEIHTGKLGWNYFPQALKARIVGSSSWEVIKLARPTILTIYRTPVARLFAPWANFCLRKGNGCR